MANVNVNAEVKMTRKEMFAHIAEVMANEAEVVAFCEKQLEALNKPRKASKSSLEAAEFRNQTLEVITGWEDFTAKEVAEKMECSVQKASNALVKLTKENILVKDNSRKPIVYNFVENVEAEEEGE